MYLSHRISKSGPFGWGLWEGLLLADSSPWNLKGAVRETLAGQWPERLLPTGWQRPRYLREKCSALSQYSAQGSTQSRRKFSWAWFPLSWSHHGDTAGSWASPEPRSLTGKCCQGFPNGHQSMHMGLDAAFQPTVFIHRLGWGLRAGLGHFLHAIPMCCWCRLWGQIPDLRWALPDRSAWRCEKPPFKSLLKMMNMAKCVFQLKEIYLKALGIFFLWWDSFPRPEWKGVSSALALSPEGVSVVCGGAELRCQVRVPGSVILSWPVSCLRVKA